MFRKMPLFTRKYKVLVTHPEVPQPAIDLLKKKCEVVVCENVPPIREDILAKAKGVHGILWANHEKLNADALDAIGPQLKSISTMSAGIDYVDVPEVKRRKIPLGHTPGVLNEAVADVGMGLLLAAARRFDEGRKKIETGTWENYHLQWMLGQEIRGSTVGFFGFGGIGQAVAKRLSGFDVGRIIYNTRRKVEDDDEYSATHVSFDELLTESDFIVVACPLTKETENIFNADAFIVVACPLTKETENIFNADAFNKMKSNCVFVNIARGAVVDQTALYNALKENKIFSAGLDVMTPEPLPSKDPLLSLPNCVLIPHLGSATLRTRTDMATIAAHNVLQGLAGEPMFAPAY